MKHNTRGTTPTWDLHDRLAKSLKHAGVSKEEIAEYLGVNTNTVSNYMAGRTRISRGGLRLWAQCTGVDLDWLVGDKDSDGNDRAAEPEERLPGTRWG